MAEREVFCPVCNANGSTQPVLRPMTLMYVEDGKSETAQPFAPPHWIITCPKCDYAEIHVENPKVT